MKPFSSFQFLEIQYDLKSPTIVFQKERSVTSQMTSKSKMLFRQLRKIGVFKHLKVDNSWWEKHVGPPEVEEDIAGDVIIYSNSTMLLEWSVFVEDIEMVGPDVRNALCACLCK